MAGKAGEDGEKQRAQRDEGMGCEAPLTCEQSTSVPKQNAEPGWHTIRTPQLKPDSGQSQGRPTNPLGLPPTHSTSDCRSVVHKQSLNRNVTEEIIAISNDNTQF